MKAGGKNCRRAFFAKKKNLSAAYFPVFIFDFEEWRSIILPFVQAFPIYNLSFWPISSISTGVSARRSRHPQHEHEQP
jgi:hypothetical protein